MFFFIGNLFLTSSFLSIDLILLVTDELYNSCPQSGNPFSEVRLRVFLGSFIMRVFNRNKTQLQITNIRSGSEKAKDVLHSDILYS